MLCYLLVRCGWGAADLPGVLAAAAPEELPANPAGRRYSSRFLQRSGCYAALFIPGTWHCLLVELLHLAGWAGLLLEEGAALPNGCPSSRLGKRRLWSTRNPCCLLGGDLQQGFTFLRGITSFSAWSEVCEVKAAAVCEGGWWAALAASCCGGKAACGVMDRGGEGRPGCWVLMTRKLLFTWEGSEWFLPWHSSRARTPTSAQAQHPLFAVHRKREKSLPSCSKWAESTDCTCGPSGAHTVVFWVEPREVKIKSAFWTSHCWGLGHGSAAPGVPLFPVGW